MRYFHHQIWFTTLSFLISFTCYGIDGLMDDETENGNRFIDKLLYDMMEENGHEYDPYKLDDSSVGFSKKIMFVNVSGEAKLHNGYITGLKTLHRPDNCKVEEKDGRLDINADLGAGVIDCYYDGTVTFMNFGPTIRVHGEMPYVEVHMEFSVDSKTGRNGELKKFKIDDLKGLKITMTGLGPMNWAMNYIISGVTTIFQGFIRNFMEKKIRNHLQERLPKYQFPVDGGDVELITEVPEPITDNPEPETEAPEVPETEAPEVPETEAPEEPELPVTESEEVIDPEDLEEPEINEFFFR